MKDREPITVKGTMLGLVLAAAWTAAAYVVFVGAVCVRVGICNSHRPGFWVPILAGCLTIGVVLRLVFPVAGSIVAALKCESAESEEGLY